MKLVRVALLGGKWPLENERNRAKSRIRIAHSQFQFGRSLRMNHRVARLARFGLEHLSWNPEISLKFIQIVEAEI